MTFLVSSMLATGVSLKPRAIFEPLRDKRLVLVALVLNFVAAPALAVVLTLRYRSSAHMPSACSCLAARPAHRSCRSLRKPPLATLVSQSRS
jgi:hypothetical protein